MVDQNILRTCLEGWIILFSLWFMLFDVVFGQCEDKSEKCTDFANQGKCVLEMDQMKEKCPHTCDLCNGNNMK